MAADGFHLEPFITGADLDRSFGLKYHLCNRIASNFVAANDSSACMSHFNEVPGHETED